ncbi:fibropellin-3-like [Magallana gigas]|uniref:fibropellin-3-like n=1 Tax=Magallana gigas TaxID=29159 RepID=UPI0033411144
MGLPTPHFFGNRPYFATPCYNGGTCVESGENYTCTGIHGYDPASDCGSRFTGTDCTSDIDECASSPCIHGNCSDNVNGYRCLCDSGYAGLHCESNVDECASSPCIHGNCTDDVNSFHCSRDVGFSGITCSSTVSSSECSSSNCNVVRCSIFNLHLGTARYYAWVSCLLSTLVLATLSFCVVFIYGIKKRQR